MKKITKAVLYIPDAQALADEIHGLMVQIAKDTDAIDPGAVRTLILGQARLSSTSYAMDDVALARVNDLDSFHEYVTKRMERDLAAEVLRGMKITTTEEDE